MAEVLPPGTKTWPSWTKAWPVFAGVGDSPDGRSARAALRAVRGPARSAARVTGRGHSGRALERRQVVADQRARQPQPTRRDVEDPGSHALAQLLRAARRLDLHRLPGLRLRGCAQVGALDVAVDDRGLPARARAAPHDRRARRR